jgi:hypothetical protein
MSRDIPESDWKLFRQLHPIALNRFCEQVLADIARIVANEKATPHERYLKIYKLVEQRDRIIGEAFNDPATLDSDHATPHHRFAQPYC